VLERAGADLVVYQAGADPYREDQLGNLGITQEGLRARDRLVLGACAERGVPCAVTLGGGYARRLSDTVAIHVHTCRAALEMASRGAQARPIPRGADPAREGR
jgi:acetoin utilization deacetylase AcuC-like enzyme